MSEEQRLAALRRYRIVDTPPEGAFDNLTALVAQLLDVPIAIISLVDEDRIWFKSHHGVEVEHVERVSGLCASAILQDLPYVLTDAQKDPRSLLNPLVAHELGFGFYAGVPLKTHDGFNLGTLCVAGPVARDVSETELDILQSLSQTVMDQIETRLALIDPNQRGADLEAAMLEINKLRSLLSICSECKKIREGPDWVPVEVYVEKYVEGVSFSHTLCPGCTDSYLADLNQISRNP